MARRFGADTVCRGARFLHACVARASASAISHAVRGTDRTCGGFVGAGADEFLEHRRTGIVSEAAFFGGRAAADPFSVHVLCADSHCGGAIVSTETLWQRNAAGCRSERIADDDSWHCPGIFPRTANYVTVVVRKVDGRHDHAIYRRRGVFLFCVRRAEARG